MIIYESESKAIDLINVNSHKSIKGFINETEIHLRGRRRWRPDQAEQPLRTALRLEKDFVPALINLADLYRCLRREDEARELLLRAVRRAPNSAEPAHALGLLYIRQRQPNDALPWLARAVELAPGNQRYLTILNLAKARPMAPRSR